MKALSRAEVARTMLIARGPSTRYPAAPRIDQEPTSAEMIETATLLEKAGLVEIIQDGEGQEAYLLTDIGERVNRMRAITNAADVDAVLDALLAEPVVGRPPVRRPPARASVRRLM